MFPSIPLSLVSFQPDPAEGQRCWRVGFPRSAFLAQEQMEE